MAAAQAQEPNVAPSGAIPSGGNSLTIHKYDGDTGTSRDDGLPKGADALNGHNPLEGVTFHLFKLDIYENKEGAPTKVDLTTNAGWQALQGISMRDLREALFEGPEIVENIQSGPVTVGEGEGAYQVTVTEVKGNQAGDEAAAQAESAQGSGQKTGADGAATFSGLDTAVYMVVEETNLRPTGVQGAVAPAAPFITTAPITHPTERNGWLQDIHVYPKNQVSDVQAKKAVVGDDQSLDVFQQAHNSGEYMKYQITAGVPSAVTAYSVTDKLPAKLGEAQDFVVKAGDETLAENTDYSVTKWTLGAESQQQHLFRVDLNETGATKARGKNLTVEFRAKVADGLAAGTSLSNTAWARPGAPLVADPAGTNWDPANGNLAGVATNEVTSTYGQVNLTVNPAEGETNVPSGAEFGLFRCDADGNVVGADGQAVGNTPDAVENAALSLDGNKAVTLTNQADAAFTTAMFPGVHLTNQAPGENGATNQTDVWNNVGSTFCLVQTKAPEGYVPLAEPITVENFGDTDTQGNVTINLVKANAGFQLPLTGGMGIVAIVVVGLAVAGGGLWWVRRDNATA